MAHDLQQLMEFRQTASQTRLVGSLSHLEVPLAVARAVKGKAQKRERLPAFPLLLGMPLSKAAEGHHASLGRLYGEREFRQALHQHLLTRAGVKHGEPLRDRAVITASAGVQRVAPGCIT